jgi:hypothetical protein
MMAIRACRCSTLFFSSETGLVVTEEVVILEESISLSKSYHARHTGPRRHPY